MENKSKKISIGMLIIIILITIVITSAVILIGTKMVENKKIASTMKS